MSSSSDSSTEYENSETIAEIVDKYYSNMQTRTETSSTEETSSEEMPELVPLVTSEGIEYKVNIPNRCRSMKLCFERPPMLPLPPPRLFHSGRDLRISFLLPEGLGNNQYYELVLENGVVSKGIIRERWVSSMTLGLSKLVTKPYVVVTGQDTELNRQVFESILEVCELHEVECTCELMKDLVEMEDLPLPSRVPTAPPAPVFE